MNPSEEKIVWDLEICKNLDLLKEADQIILYGVGGKGREVLGWLRDAGIKICYFCDRDMEKWGKQLEDVHILSPFQMAELENLRCSGTYLIACIQCPQELCGLLEHMGLRGLRVVTCWGIRMALRIHAAEIYGKDSKRFALLQMEKQWNKNGYLNLGLAWMKSLLEASDETIWIVQPGKTASTSLEVRLKKHQIPFIKEHHLEYPGHILGEEYRVVWEKQIRERKAPLKVIAAVREPLSRDYSAFWQAFTEGVEHIMWMPLLTHDFQKMYENYLYLILKGSAFTKKTLGNSMPYTWNEELEWFDEQIKRPLGIDVFQYPFDREKGYTIIKKEHVELFLFKVEKMEEIIGALSTFTGAAELSAVNANVAQQKWYGLAYDQFRKEVKLPAEYVRHYYQGNSKLDHFYTQEEKERFLEKWQKNIKD